MKDHVLRYDPKLQGTNVFRAILSRRGGGLVALEIHATFDGVRTWPLVTAVDVGAGAPDPVRVYPAMMGTGAERRVEPWKALEPQGVPAHTALVLTGCPGTWPTDWHQQEQNHG